MIKKVKTESVLKRFFKQNSGLLKILVNDFEYFLGDY